MMEIIVPCPGCQTSLLVDEQNAGHDVMCPGCRLRLTLPSDLSGNAAAVIKGTVATPPPPPASPEPSTAKRNHPLYRSGHLSALPAEIPNSAPAAANRASNLPEHRGLSPEEEMRRLAALTASPVAFDLHNVDTKGRTAFPCPCCHRPVWIARSDWGQVLVCDGCAQEVVAPDPSKGAPACLLQNDGNPEPRQKTVLPGRRQVENLPVGEQTAAGRPKRQGGQHPPARDTVPAPPSQASERGRTPLPRVEPIPVRGDVEMAPQSRTGPPAAKRVVPPPQEQSAVAAAFEDLNAAEDVALADALASKAVHRINPERLPNFTPKHEADLSAETAGNWGGESPQENSVAFRRILTAAIITLLLGAIGVAGYLLKETFAPHDHSAEMPDDANPVQNVDDAKTTLKAFFSAEKIEDMAKHVRHPEMTLPRMKAWYAATGVPRHSVEFTVNWVEHDNFQNRGVDFIVTTVTLNADKNMEAALEVPKDGSPPKLDWEHFVSWSERPWSEFLRTTSERPGDFRVAITPTDYYNAYFNDRARYLAFRVSDRENFGACYAYCEVKSTLGNLLLKAVREARQSGRPGMTDPATDEGIAHVILRLHFPPEGQKFNQATIDALVWNEWLEP